MEIIIIRYTHHVFIISSQLYSSCTATEVYFTLASTKGSWREKVKCSLTTKDNMVRKSYRINLKYIPIILSINFRNHNSMFITTLFQYQLPLDVSGKCSKRHVSGSESIQTNNSQAPLTNSVGDKTAYLGHKRRSLFAIESLMFLSILGTQTGRLNDMHERGNKVSN